MGKVDSTAKEYFSDNTRFADLCNYVLFDGEKVIIPDALEEKDSTEVLSVFGTDEKQIQIQKWRDLLKSTIIKSCNNVYIALIGIEAQANIHYAMPVKNMIYDALNYGYQVKEAAKKHREKRDTSTEDEFLSGYTLKDTLTPVITITVYLGENDWDAPRKLSDMYGEVDERMRPFLSDFNANVLVPKEIEDFDKFSTELKQVFEVLKAAGNKDDMNTLLESDEKFRNLENETVNAINVFSNTKISINKKGKVTDMCKAWQDQYLDGENNGRLKEIFSSVQEGDYSLERGAEKAGMTIPEFEKSMTEAGYKVPAGV